MELFLGEPSRMYFSTVTKSSYLRGLSSRQNSISVRKPSNLASGSVVSFWYFSIASHCERLPPIPSRRATPASSLARFVKFLRASAPHGSSKESSMLPRS